MMPQTTTAVVLATLRFRVPLPPRELSPNWRGAWQLKNMARKDYRRTVVMMAMHEVRLWERRTHETWKPASQVRLCLTFGVMKPAYRHLNVSYRPKDDDNAGSAFKAGRDALKDAGVIVDDSRDHLSQMPVEWSNDFEGIEVTVEVLRW